MIGARDRLWIAAKKLAMRKRWMAFTLFSLSLGLTVFTATTSMAEGVRAAFVGTMELMTRKVPPDNVRILPRDPKAPTTAGAKEHAITSGQCSRIATLPGVEAVSTQLVVKNVKLGIELETLDPVMTLTGMEDAFLARFVPPGRKLWERPDRVPVVMGRYVLQSQFDPKAERFRVRRGFAPGAFVGREIELVLGANANIESGFKEEYRDGRKRIGRSTPQERMSRQSEQFRYLRNQYDMNIFQRALKLKAVIAGVGDTDTCMIPMSVARDAHRWLVDRESLANRRAATSGRSAVASEVPGEAVVWALARTVDDVGRVADGVKALGLHPIHRGTMMKDAMEDFSSAMTVVRMIFYGIGAVIFGVSCLFVWSTMSKVIADSRREIGVFRAVGATRRDVLSIFLLQATLLGLGGALLGVACGFGVAAGISRAVLAYVRGQDLSWDVEQYGFEAEDVLPAALYSVDPMAVGLMIAGAVVASLMAGLVPAWRAARMDPVAALQRRE